MVLRVILSTALVLGLIRLLSVVLARYAPGGVTTSGYQRRLRLLETLSLPGGGHLHVVSYNGNEILIGTTRDGIQPIQVDEAVSADANE